MAAYVASVTGNWADSATWGGSGPPVSGDSVTINTGRTVTVAASTTADCGTSPDNVTTFDVTLSGTAQLVVNGTLNVKSNINVEGGGVITINGGGVLNIDASARPTTKEHLLRLGNTGSGKLVMNDNATITAPVGSAWYQSAVVTTNGAQLDVNGTATAYATMRRMQRSGNTIGWANPFSSAGIDGTGKFEVSHCIMDGCDDFSVWATGGFTSRWEWVRFKNSTGSANVVFAQMDTSITKIAENCTFDLNVGNSGTWATSASIRPNNCYFDGSFTLSATTGGTLSNFWNTKRSTVQGSGPNMFHPALGGTIISHEILWKDYTGGNPHFNALNNGLAGSRTFDGAIHIYEGTSTDGDCVFVSSTDASTTTVRNFLFVPNSNGSEPGTWCSQLGTAGVAHKIEVYHCTGVISGATVTPKGITVGETVSATASRINEVKSNIAYEASAGEYLGGTRGFLTQMQPSQSTNEPFNAANIDYNVCYATNVTNASTAYCSAAEAPSVATQTIPTAANDIYGVDPQLLNKARNMRAWAQWWGTRIGATGDSVTTPGTAATAVNARLLMLAMHDGTFAETLTADGIKTQIQWIRRGHLSTNTALRGMGHDGLTPGIFGGWLPTLSGISASASGGAVTTNIADGTLYWVITDSATTPDWDRVLAGKDHTGTAVTGGRSGNQAVSASGAQVINISGATLLAGNNYLHVAHKGAGSEAALDDYLKTSEPVTSAAFQDQGASGNIAPMSFIRKLRQRRAA